ncbi:MAG: bifunctional adenosylcobinamide kinase/adenosylcobinamide-phosphate guanylyltransferase [Chloroflexota bacterium]|nr:bifunctional adenosylcobinamide kinase/adenosylcobinamide-phosphate guanylyltransferase [Chloroflexota bacterium]
MDIINSGKYLFLGGARSGKSYLAEQAIASRHPEICYVATSPRAWALADPDFAGRIVNHQRRRGANWQTVELDDPEKLYDLIENAAVPTLVDSVGGWLASDIDFVPDLARLKAAILSCPTYLSFVAEEAGLSVHAESLVARTYVDLLGQTNQAISKAVDRVFFVAAGRATELYTLDFLTEGQ